MLDALPVEVLAIIIGHLPTASSVLSLSLGNQKLQRQISANDYALLKSFVKNRFPSIQTPPFWRDAAIALTARSRAWDRRALIARECRPPNDDTHSGFRPPAGLKSGFVPAIDSYETWAGNTWIEKKEVLAVGAAGRMRLRTTRDGKSSWSTYRTRHDHLPQNDIMDIRLLRPHQNHDPSGEAIVLRRANHTITKVISTPSPDVFKKHSSFSWSTDSQSIDSMDISGAAEPLLVVCNSREAKLYPVNSRTTLIEPCDITQLEHHRERKVRMRCAKFLSTERLALGPQSLEGLVHAPIEIYDISPAGIRPIPTHFRNQTFEEDIGRHCASSIAPLDPTSSLAGRPGDVFLSGWTDGVTRLFDLRTDDGPSAEYHDNVDDCQIMSLLPIGHEKFFAGSHQNACLKRFDLRMAGGRAYSYSNSTLPAIKRRPATKFKGLLFELYGGQHHDINIFLTLNVPRARRLWEPLPKHPDANMPRYRGSVYSLSSPSPSSPTVYAGIENHVIQLDFVSTDDMRKNYTKQLSLGLPGESESARPILSLSCYQRPPAGCEMSQPVILRKQVPNPRFTSVQYDFRIAGFDKAEEGWDDRWRCPAKERMSQSGWR